MPGTHQYRSEELATEYPKRQRLRDLSQYYCATSPSVLEWNTEGYLGTKQHAKLPVDIAKWTPRPPVLAADPVLTSLTQAAALRLGVERCLVSIVDDRYQHVIAEATRSVSPFDIHHHDQGDEVLLGAQPLPVKWGVCSTVLSTFVDSAPIPFSQTGNICSQSGILISDLVTEDRSCFIPAVLQNRQRLRFYAGVPLLSAAGNCIGVVCAFDPKPRTAQIADLEILQTSTRVISQYLSTMRLQLDNARAQQLLGGMADFLHQGNEVANEDNIRHTLVSDSRLSRGTVASKDPFHPAPSAIPDRARSKCENMTTDKPVDSNPKPDVHFPENKVPDSVKRDSSADVAPAQQVSPDPSTNLTIDFAVQKNATDFDSIFVRASKLIRHCMELDGTCFLEVPHKQRFHLTNMAAADELDWESDSTSVDTTTATDSSTENAVSAGETLSSHDASHCLAFSNVGEDDPLIPSNNLSNFVFPSRLLIELSSRYPKGHIFHFDRFGGVTSDEDDSTSVVAVQQTSRIVDQVFTHFKAARSLMFLPLYDNIGPYAYAGFFGWTNDQKRSLQERDLIYVSGFANNIMSEVVRRQSLEVEKVKSDFISSISHELRSPLHGVLAANQLLSESILSREQTELVKTVGNCAVTLLDVFNQLFDYAKITTFHGTSRLHRRNHKRAKGSVKPEQMPQTRICLASLLENTVSSLVAHASHLNSPIIELDLSLTHAGQRAPLSEASPFIIVDIDFETHRQYLSHSGLWRTIILNLLGNAIKYTEGGYILVSLKIHEMPGKSASTKLVDLRVQDTGQGMSEYFLRHRCFEPYAQEDPLAVGTGVGLSIVQHAVNLLQGTAKIDSKQGLGTEVVVQAPVTLVPERARDNTLCQNSIELDLTAYRGIKFHLASIPDADQIRSSSTEAPDGRRKKWNCIEAALISLMTKWFGMQVASSEHAELIFVEQQAFEESLKVYDVAGVDIIVILLLQARETQFEAHFANVVTVQSPLGRRAIMTALQKLKNQKADRAAKTREAFLAIPERPPLRRSRSSHSQGSASTISSLAPPSIISATSTSSGETPPSQTRPEKALILLVDDNELNLRILKIMVQKLKLPDMEAITASDGQQAVDCFVRAADQGRSIPFVFMDITMPVMDGMEATRQIREYEAAKGREKEGRACIVAVTGLASAKDQRDIFASGIDTCVTKPANLNTLRHILLDRKHNLQRPND